MSTNPVPSRRLGTLKHLARHRQVSERTCRNWAAAGYLRLYRTQGVQGVVVDLDEADEALDRLVEQGLVRPQYATFNGHQVTHLVTEVTR
jgi:hypothetical protein